MRIFCSILVLSMYLPSTGAADSPPADAGKIAELVAQLGSGSFPEREQASRMLESIGPGALQALRQAAKSSDPEVCSRAEELVRELERRVDSMRLLTPKQVQLSYQDTPQDQAIADFQHRTGFRVQPLDSSTLRKITLQTREVTLWEALEQFSAAADVVEDPRPVSSSHGAYDVYTIRSPDVSTGSSGAIVPASPALREEAKRQRSLPTCYSGALRIRALPTGTPGWGQTPGVVSVPCRLEVTPEPGNLWQAAVDVRITRAVDGQGQELEQVVGFPVIHGAGYYGGNQQGVLVAAQWFAKNPYAMASATTSEQGEQVTFRLKLGKKPSPLVKELEGVLVGRVQTPLEEIISIPDVLKCTGQAVHGADGFALKVVEPNRERDGLFKIQVELQYPVAEPGAVGFPFNNLALNQALVWQLSARSIGSEMPNLVLRDNSGRTFDAIRYNEAMHTENGRTGYSATLYYRVPVDQGQSASLIWLGRRQVIVEAPFTLKDVPLP